MKGEITRSDLLVGPLHEMALFDLTGWAYFSLDPSGCFAEVSDRLAQLLGTSRDALVGVSLTSLCTEPYDSLLSAYLLQPTLSQPNDLRAGKLHLFLALKPLLDSVRAGSQSILEQTVIPVELVALFSKEESHPHPSDTEIAVIGLIRPTASDLAATEKSTKPTETEQKRSKQLQATAQIGQRIGATEDLDTLLSYLVNMLCRDFHYTYASVYLLDDRETHVVLHTSNLPARPHTLASGKDGDRSNLEQRSHYQQPGSNGQGGDQIRIGEQGIVGMVAGSGKPILISDVATLPHNILGPDSPDTRSAAAIPLAVSGRVVGVLEVRSDTPGALTPDDMDFLQILADLAAIAVENASLLEERDQHMAELAALNQIGLLLASPRDLMETLDAIIRHVNALFQVEAASLMLVEDGQLHFKVAAGTQIDQIKPFTLAIGDGIAGWVVRHNQTVRVDDVTTDPRHYTNIDQAIDFTTKSLIAAPLRIMEYPEGKERVLGVIEIINRLNGHPFTRNEEVLLEFIASSAAAVIENSRLFNELQRRLEEMSALHDASHAVSTLELQSVLNTIVARVNTTLNAEQTLVYLLDDDEHHLMPQAMASLDPSGFDPSVFALGEGTVGLVAQTCMPLRVDDAKNDPRFVPISPMSNQVRCTLGVPLSVQDGLIGVLEVVNKQDKEHFTQADETLLSAFAGMAAIAIEKARMHEETSRRLAEVSTLYMLANQVTTVLDLDRVLEVTVTIINHALNCQGCCLYLRDAQTGDLTLKASSGWRHWENKVADLNFISHVSRQVLRECRPANLTDVKAHEIAENSSIRSVLVIPLITNNEAIGTLSVDARIPEAFGSSDGRLLTIAAAQVSVAIENARLLRSLRDRATTLERTLEELRILNRLRTEFVQNVSHELRTPLTFVKGYVQLMLEGAMGELSQEMQQSLSIVDQRTEAVIRLVNDVISLEQVEVGALEFQLVSLAEVAMSSVRGAMMAAKKAELQIELEIADGLPLIHADPGRLGQVFDNLLGNAIKFSPAHSIITVRVLPEGRFVRVDVVDQGIGIPADKLDRIFDRFYQVDGSTTRRYSGTGLGLAIVRTIIEAHGGQIVVESELGGGSTFSLILPIPDNESG